MKPMLLLRTFLGLGAVTWAAAIPGVFVSWNSATAAMEGFGAGRIAYDRMVDYWIRMASGAFGFIGLLFVVLLIWPRRHRDIIPWFAALSVLEGIILLIHGLRLSLPPFPFYGDVSACLLSGCGCWMYWRNARSELYGQSPNQEVDAEAGGHADSNVHG